VLEENRPALLIEVSRDPDDPESSGHAIVRLLAELGYEPFLLREGTLRRRRSGDRSVNYFFLTGEHRAALRTARFPIEDITG